MTRDRVPPLVCGAPGSLPFFFLRFFSLFLSSLLLCDPSFFPLFPPPPPPPLLFSLRARHGFLFRGPPLSQQRPDSFFLKPKSFSLFPIFSRFFGSPSPSCVWAHLFSLPSPAFPSLFPFSAPSLSFCSSVSTDLSRSRLDFFSAWLLLCPAPVDITSSPPYPALFFFRPFFFFCPHVFFLSPPLQRVAFLSFGPLFVIPLFLWSLARVFPFILPRFSPSDFLEPLCVTGFRCPLSSFAFSMSRLVAGRKRLGPLHLFPIPFPTVILFFAAPPFSPSACPPSVCVPTQRHFYSILSPCQFLN